MTSLLRSAGGSSGGRAAAAEADPGQGTSRALDAMQGGISTISAIAQIGAAEAQAATAESQARLVRFQARAAQTDNDNEIAAIWNAYAQAAGSARAAGAARGIDTGSGPVATAITEGARQARRATDSRDNQTAIQRRLMRLQARSLMQRARSARIAGAFGAAASLGQGVASVAGAGG